MKENLAKRLAGEHIAPYEVELLTKDGEKLWGEINATRIKYDGKPVDLAVFRDVTERKRMAEKLIESEQKYRSLVDYAVTGIAVVDLKGRLIYVNKALADLMGYNVKEMLNCPFKKLVHPKDKGRVVRLFLNIILLRRNPRYLEFRAVRKDGGVIHLWTKPSRLKINGKTVGFQAIIIDVTERKKSEEALKAMVEGIPDAVLIHDEDGRILYANDVACKQLGYSFNEMLSMSTKDFDTPEFAKGFKDRLRLQSTQESYSVEGAHLTKSGKRLDVSVNTKKITYKGRPAVLAVVRNITEHKRAVEALEHSEEQYRLLVENSNEAILAVQNAMIKFANPRASEIIGYSREELASKPFVNFIHPDDREMVVTRYQRRLKGDKLPHVYSFRVIDNNGNVKWVEINSVLFNWEGKPATLSFLNDITERKQAEEMLLKSEEKYRDLVENLNDVIYTVDMDGVVIYVSPAVKSLIGYTPSEVVGHHFKDFFIQDDWPSLMRLFQNVLSGRTTANEVRIKTKSGKIRWIRTSNRPIFEGDRMIGVQGVLMDITENKKMEDELRESEEKFRSLAEESPNMIFIHDMKRVVYANKICEKVMGYKREEIYSPDFNFLVLIAPESRDSFKKSFSNHLKGEECPSYEYSLITKDGRRLGAILTTRLIKYGDGQAILGIVTDITDLKKVENISKLREKLRKLFSLSDGLNQILDNALEDLNMDAGAILIIDRKSNIVKTRISKSVIKGGKIDESYPLDRGFFELKAGKANMPISKILGGTEPSILRTKSIHCAPILFGKDVYGVLALGSQKDHVLKNSDLAVLSLYSELTSTLFETRSLKITPRKEAAKVVKRRFPLEPGYSYLVKDDIEKAYEIFTDNALSGLPGLCITREFPAKIRLRYGLEKTPIIWLTEEKAEDMRTVYSLQDLSILIDQFLDKVKRGVVLLDGLEYLVVNHGFDSFIHFLQLTRNRFEKKDSILIAPLMEEALDVKEAKLIEREMKPLISKNLWDPVRKEREKIEVI